MIYDRFGQRIVPGSLMLRIETGALYVAVEFDRNVYGIGFQQRRVEAVGRAALFVPAPVFDIPGTHLRMVEVIRYVELF